MKAKLFYKNFLLILGIDIFLLSLVWYGAHLVRFDFAIPTEHYLSLKLLPIIVLTKIFAFYVFDLYRGMWRYTSIADLINIVKAASVSSLLIVGAILFSTRFIGFARSVF